MTGSKKNADKTMGSPDALIKTGNDAKIELSEQELKSVSGGATNNEQTTAQKAAEKADSYIRS
jgi:bacteriocin-like protein